MPHRTLHSRRAMWNGGQAAPRDHTVSVPIICQPGMRFCDGHPLEWSPTDTDEESNVDLAPFVSGTFSDDPHYVSRYRRILHSIRAGPAEEWPTMAQLRFLSANQLHSLIVCDPSSGDSPTRHGGWTHWFNVYQHMARDPITVQREPHICTQYWEISQAIAPILSPMVYMEAHGSAWQFQGWLPTTAFIMLLADRGMRPNRDELELMVSVTQMFPTAPNCNPYVAVLMFRIPSLTEGSR